MSKILFKGDEPNLWFTHKALNDYNFISESEEKNIIVILFGTNDGVDIEVSDVYIPKQSVTSYSIPKLLDEVKFDKSSMFVGVSYVTKSKSTTACNQIDNIVESDRTPILDLCNKLSKINFDNGNPNSKYAVLYERNDGMKVCSVFDYITGIEFSELEISTYSESNEHIATMLKDNVISLYSTSTTTISSPTNGITKKEPSELLKTNPKIGDYK